MRAVLIAGLLVVAALGGEALAQGGGQGGGNAKDKQHRPPPPPPPRCADLALGDYTLLPAAPDGAPLGANEIAVRWEVRNAGTGAYQSVGASQWLALEYVMPGGPQQIATNPLPPQPSGAAAPSQTSGVTLTPGANWRGVLRATLPAEAARRPLRLRLAYAPYRGPGNDCDMNNNTARIVR